MKSFCIIIPRLDKTGPIKGAIATAVEIAKTDKTTIISLFKSQSVNRKERLELDLAGVSLIEYDLPLPLFILAAIRLRKDVLSSGFDGILSFLLPVDIVLHVACIGERAVASIRQDMYDNYHFDFYPFGNFVSRLHFHIIKKRVCICLNERVESQLAGRARSVVLLPNFIISKSKYLGHYSFSGGIRFVYVGSLSQRKNPLVAVEQFIRIKSIWPSAKLDIFGEGPLKGYLYDSIHDHNLEEHVHLRGFSEDIEDRLSAYHFIISPSHSEGVSRAAMEALDKGVFLLASDIPGMVELTRCGGGRASNNTDELLIYIDNVVKTFGERERRSLLPDEFYSDYVISRLINLLVSTMSETGK